MLDRIVEYDHELFLFLNNLGSEGWDGFWLIITNKFTSVPLYLVLLFFCVKKLGWRMTLLVLAATGLMIAFTDQVANVFKYGFERLRPCHDPLLQGKMRIVKCGGKFGYFSAHAGSTFAVATFFSLLLGRYYRSLTAILVLWALVVSYSRIYLGVHFPTDVLTGMVVGVSAGFLFLVLLRWTSKKVFKSMEKPSAR
ncbi:phosphatase PAP2 family protein [Sinomicrobium oceani]|uniref:phosphatase PAP2 family protein n=1 Tax=Sinomicrobium oceani TaxID=1150368 RepID=UPI00227CAADA|nr:phosphatase PAP2 family protein [Sinomicrobium oceani]